MPVYDVYIMEKVEWVVRVEADSLSEADLLGQTECYDDREFIESSIVGVMVCVA